MIRQTSLAHSLYIDLRPATGYEAVVRYIEEMFSAGNICQGCKTRRVSSLPHRVVVNRVFVSLDLPSYFSAGS